MPIINGKKRYLPESGSEVPDREEPRRAPWIMSKENTAAVPPQVPEKKRYKAQVEEEKPGRKIKRYSDGGVQVTAAVTHGIGEFVGNYEFSVQFGGLGDISFSKVSNLGGSIEVGTFVEGGNNSYPMIYKTPRRQPDMLVLQKGVVDSATKNLLLSQLKEGTKVYGVFIFVKKNKTTVKKFSITEGIIVSRKYASLDANSSHVFLQQLEIAHTGITEV